MSNYFFPQLTDEKRFESLVADIYRERFPNAKVTTYGRRGQKQNGIDITVQNVDGSLWCIQCKNKKAITPAEIKSILKDCTYNQINSFCKLIIATASANDKAITDYLIGVQKDYTYQIEYLPWDRICDFIEQYRDIFQRYYTPLIGNMKSKFAEIIVKYGIEAYVQIDPLVEGLEVEWPFKIDDCVSELQNMLNRNPLSKGETIYCKIYEFMKCMYDYNGYLGCMMFWYGDPNDKLRYYPPYNGIDTRYEEKQNTVLKYRSHIIKLLHEICTG